MNTTYVMKCLMLENWQGSPSAKEMRKMPTGPRVSLARNTIR